MPDSTQDIAPILNLGSTAPVAAKEQVVERKLRPALPADRNGWWWGTGRRKTAVARVRLRPAGDKAAIAIRGQSSEERSIESYFSEERDRADVMAPLTLTGTAGKMEVHIRAHGGGFMGQAQAVRLGIARALRNYDPTLEAALREAGFLTRDAREVERKKYGQAGARRRFQFSKR